MTVRSRQKLPEEFKYTIACAAWGINIIQWTVSIIFVYARGEEEGEEKERREATKKIIMMMIKIVQCRA